MCLHGLTANCRCWDNIAEALTPEYRVLAPDLRGRGYSEAPDRGYGLEQHARDVVAVCDNLGLDRPAVMGHSMGAAIALAVAAQYPERVSRAVLIDAGAKLPEEQMKKVLEWLGPSLGRLGVVFPSVEAYMAPMKRAAFLMPWTETLERSFRYELEEVEGGVRCTIEPEHITLDLAALQEADVSDYYPGVKCPVLVLRAPVGIIREDDLLLPEGPLREMLDGLPTARCVDVEGTNHYTIVWHPNWERDRTIRAFLAEGPPA
jgi:pimeloyl-ACP methyl ester carboxylesterase